MILLALIGAASLYWGVAHRNTFFKVFGVVLILIGWKARR